MQVPKAAVTAQVETFDPFEDDTHAVDAGAGL